MATMPIDVAGSDEFVDTIQIESSDYTDYELLSVGTYASPSRLVEAEKRTDKNGKPFLMAKLEFNELYDAEGNRMFLRKPLTRYVFSFTRKQRGHQGETSDISKYLKAAGIELGGAVTGDALKEALLESGQYPIKVKVGWTNRTPKVGDEYLPEKAYTNDFNRGANGTPVFVPRISQDDVNAMQEKAQARLSQVLVNGFINAKHKVEDFWKV
jgi:hypothetical protein